MNRPSYDNLVSSADIQTFYFDSEGRYGVIRKAIVYTPITKLVNTYNLGFGTLKRNSNGNFYIDGKDKTNNGDINLVLSTVAKTVEIYLTTYPKRKIFFKGYSLQLTKIYQRAILHDLNLIAEKYKVLANKDSRDNYYMFEPFDPKNEYYGFLIENRSVGAI